MFTFLIVVLASVFPVQDWKFVAPIQSPEIITQGTVHDGWYVLELSKDIISTSENQSASDISLVDISGEVIPFSYVQAQIQPHMQSTSTVRVVEDLSVHKGERILVLDVGKEGQEYTGVGLDVATHTEKYSYTVTTYISDTPLKAQSPAWKMLERKTTFTEEYVASDMYTQKNIKFPSVSSRYVKLRIIKNEANSKFIDIQNIHLISEQTRPEQTIYTLSTTTSSYILFTTQNPVTDISVYMQHVQKPAVHAFVDIGIDRIASSTPIPVSMGQIVKNPYFKEVNLVRTYVYNIAILVISVLGIYGIFRWKFKGLRARV